MTWLILLADRRDPRGRFGLLQAPLSVVRRATAAGIYQVSRLSPRDPRRWVFGNIRGFRDNPRYLAEYVARSHPEIEAWWIARSTQEAEAAKSVGIHVALRGRSSVGPQLRAGVAFLSNGFQDLNGALLGGAFVVDLRHGQGTKPILLDRPDLGRSSKSAITRASARLRRWYTSRRLAQIDMIVAPGLLEKEHYLTAFGGSPSRIHVLGSPRFDVILGELPTVEPLPTAMRSRLVREQEEFVALWLPTWRESGERDWLPPVSEALLEAKLGDTKVTLLLKPHPFSDHGALQARLPRHPRLQILTDGGEDVNLLLRMADALVTDYSSAAFDYALLDRPIVFFAPDLERYRHTSGLLPFFDGLLGARNCSDWPALLDALRRVGTGDTDESIESARIIRATSANADEPGSCERIVAAVCAAIALPAAAGP